MRYELNKPIMFSDRKPGEQDNILAYDIQRMSWYNFRWASDIHLSCYYTHWLPASALPVPESAVCQDSLYRCHECRTHGSPEKQLEELEILRGKVEDLKDLVVDAWWADRSDKAESNYKRWMIWSSQYTILQHNS